MKHLLANHNARLYLSANIVSTFGDRVLFLAAAIWVRVLSGSNAEAGLTIFFLVLPQMAFSPIAGVLADRFRRRPLLIAANLLGAASVLPLLLVRGPGEVWVIYLVMVLYGAIGTLISAAGTALLVTVVPSEDLGQANGFIQTLSEGMRLITPLVGAGLFTLVGGAVVAELDVATFLIASCLLWRMVLQESRPVPGQQHWLKETTAGFSHIWRTADLRQVMVALILAISVIGFLETAIFAVVTSGLHRPASFVGVVVSIQGVGAVAGGVTAALVMRRIGELRLTALGIAAMALGSAGLIWPNYLSGFPSLALVVVGVAVFGFGLPWLLVGAITLVQLRTPLGLQGRVDAAFGVLFGGVQTASIGVGALLVGALGYVPPVLAVVAVGSLAAAYLYSRQRLPVRTVAGSPLAASPPGPVAIGPSDPVG
ncbi:MAG: MFS transporter [Candidatus Dormibacteria bacterium]